MVCAVCRDETAGNGGYCQSCGRALPTVATLGPAVARAVGLQPSIIRDGVDPSSGGLLIQVDDPGTSSETRRAADGTMTTSIRGEPNVGRAGEKRLLKTLRQVLAGKGHIVLVGQAIDAQDEDGRFTVDGREMVVQAVTVPGKPSFWRDARLGAKLSVDGSEALQWLATAIEEKARRTSALERAKTILAIDARRWGTLAAPTLVEAYLRTCGEPTVKIGLAAVWLVGPTHARCVRLGTGWP